MNHDTDDHRQETALNGAWEFVTDPNDVGEREGWYERDGRWPSRARSVEVPHIWQEHSSHRDYTGTAWYRRTVAVEPPMDSHTLIRFGAADYETTVWVNGTRIDTNRGGYLPFTVDATDAIVDGENEIVVRMVDPDDISEIPHGKQGEPWYGRVSGIWQDVTLETVPSVRVADVRITPDIESNAASIRIDLSGEEGQASVGTDASYVARTTISRDGEEVATATPLIGNDGSGTATVTIADPDYWTPETPALYDVRVELESDGEVVDRYEDYFGMRSMETRDGQFYLNGEPYFIRGALDQGYYPQTLYRPFADDLFEREVRMAKELGFNLLRKHIKPAHPDFLECADRLGLLVWEEPANPTVHTRRSTHEVRDQITGMIDRDYNRPSVVIWSLYNEEWGIGNPQGLDDETSLWEDEDKQDYLAELYEDVKALDPTRLVCDNSGWAHVATDINDYHRYFISPDRADAWSEDLDRMVERPEDNYGAVKTDPEDAPIVISEFGTWGMHDVRSVEEFYGQRPPWYDHAFLEGLKRPKGFRERFEESALSETFDSLDSLSTAWQWREFRSNKDLIERMRRRDGVAGYVITELSDIEWEFNGILDYRREPKAFHEEFAAVNAPIAVQLDPDSRVVYDDERVRSDAIVTNDTNEEVEAELSWDAFDESDKRTVTLDPASTARIDEFIDITVPSVEETTTESITVRFGDHATVTDTVTIGPRSKGAPTEMTIYADEGLRSLVEDQGLSVAPDLDGAVDGAAVVELTDTVLEFAEDGGNVLLFAGEDGSADSGQTFDYRELPATESWNLVASLFHTVDASLRDVLPKVPGWELGGLYPNAVMELQNDDEVELGYVEGWIANPAAAIATRHYGTGTIRVCTLPLLDAYGSHPTATALVDTMLMETVGEPTSSEER